MKRYITIICVIILVIITLGLCLISYFQKDYGTLSSQIEYKNTEYGFAFSLPKSWEGYSIVNKNWEGRSVDGENSSTIINGPEILIRHPLWTSENPRQDIPVMIFTYDEWNLIEQEKLSVSAAPIGPSELGNNAKYVFAIPARYNFAYPTGFEEVQLILESKSFRAFPPISTPR
jgi:hypothetical protein